MDYEKKYNEALERAKEFMTHKGVAPNVDAFKTAKELTETIFPELKESKDERIRKGLIKGLSAMKNIHNHQTFSDDAINIDDAIAWLEKQGEQKHKIQPKFKIGDIIRFKGNETLKGEAEAHKIVGYDNELYVFADGTTDLFCEQDLYELVEQKSADNGEPKFKVGDWIVYEGLGAYKVVEIHEGWYSVIDSNDRRWSVMFEKESLCHLWTIQDSKDGDVLSQDSIPFIFKSWDNNCKAYCGVTDFGLFKVVEDDFSWCNGIDVTPATKEQRDLLFQKMKDAGYEWDTKKKELKKIEQNPTWSEEDEKFYTSALWHVKNSCGNGGKDSGEYEVYNWLKSLKNRFQPQPKQEWSEKDTRILQNVIRSIKISRSSCEEDDDIKDGYDEELDWLKSLKPNHWKPSEYDISLLEEIAKNIRNNVRPFCSEVSSLEDLIENLKTL